MRAPVLLATGVGVATLALHLRDPHDSTWVVCPTAALGFWCPGCGGLRSVNDLTHFELADAASSNVLFVASVPLLILGWLWWMRRAWQGRSVRAPDRVVLRIVAVVVVLMAIFTVVRNLPAGAWFAP